MKHVKIANKIIITIIIIFSLGVSIYYLIQNDILGSLKKLIIIPIIFIPSFMRYKFQWNFKYILETIFLLFLFFAWYLGYALNIYNVFNGYDKIIHGLFGIIVCFFSIYIMKYFQIYKNQNLWFNIIFFLSFSLALGCFWEFIEFTDDKLFGKNEQGVVETGVDDTMYDLIVTAIGSLIFCICYYIELIFKKELVIKKYIKLLN